MDAKKALEQTDAETLTKLAEAAEMSKAFGEALSATINVAMAFWSSIKAALCSEETWEVIRLSNDLRYHRLVELALHHPKKRVRKKNIKRIKRIVRRCGKL